MHNFNLIFRFALSAGRYLESAPFGQLSGLPTLPLSQSQMSKIASIIKKFTRESPFKSIKLCIYDMLMVSVFPRPPISRFYFGPWAWLDIQASVLRSTKNSFAFQRSSVPRLSKFVLTTQQHSARFIS